MRMPALRLPAWRPSLDWTEGLGSRSTILYALYTVVLFCVFLFANFPHKVLVQRVLRSVQVPGLRLDVGDVRFAWWRGFELQHVLVAPSDPSLPAFFESPSLYVRPAISDLVRGKIQSVDLSGPLYGGTLDGTLSSGDVNRVTLNVAGLQLQSYPFFGTLLQGGQLAGRLSGAVSVEAHGSDIADVRAAGDLQLTDASLADAKYNQFPLPPLHFKSINTQLRPPGGPARPAGVQGRRPGDHPRLQRPGRDARAVVRQRAQPEGRPGARPGCAGRREDPSLGADSAAGQGRQGGRAAHPERHPRQAAPALTRCALFGTARID